MAEFFVCFSLSPHCMILTEKRKLNFHPTPILPPSLFLSYLLLSSSFPNISTFMTLLISIILGSNLHFLLSPILSFLHHYPPFPLHRSLSFPTLPIFTHAPLILVSLSHDSPPFVNIYGNGLIFEYVPPK
uniref:Uncharacterized protein n=1 Tax=Cacopsylla melanoneura TaxID=428564 RepID=A0A8D8W732_9HEMI